MDPGLSINLLLLRKRTSTKGYARICENLCWQRVAPRRECRTFPHEQLRRCGRQPARRRIAVQLAGITHFHATLFRPAGGSVRYCRSSQRQPGLGLPTSRGRCCRDRHALRSTVLPTAAQRVEETDESLHARDTNLRQEVACREERILGVQDREQV